MATYQQSAGSGGTLQIVDNNPGVVFSYKADYDSDHYEGLQFSWTTPSGQTIRSSINYNGGWQQVGTDQITGNGTLTFRLLTNTGIGGMGGPASMSINITNRGGGGGSNPPPSIHVPAAPSRPTAVNITDTAMTIQFNDGGDGGGTIDDRRIGFGDSAAGPAHVIDGSGNSQRFTGLIPGVTYYFWARTHNQVGWSDWSERNNATTLDTPGTPSMPAIGSGDITQTSVAVSMSLNGNGGDPITGYQFGYSTGTDPTDHIVNANGTSTTITGLAPATKYNFYARVRNDIGWSNWSGGRTASTLAGLWVKVGTTWVQAIPYVNVGGTWKVAQPWARSQGFWEVTS